MPRPDTRRGLLLQWSVDIRDEPVERRVHALGDRLPYLAAKARRRLGIESLEARLRSGKPALFGLIEKANPQLKSQPTLRVGKKLTIPAPPAGSSSAKGALANRPGFRTHKIVDGDSLYRLAERLLGDPLRWTEIAKANPDLDPDNLKVGVTIYLPLR